MRPEESLRGNFEALGLTESSIEWLIDLWHALQGLDDLVDEDQTSLSEQYDLIWRVLVALPANSFFQAHSTVLLSAVANMYLKWRAAETVERGRIEGHFDKAYVWRAGYYDVVLQCVLLVHGPEKAGELAASVLSLYGETLDDYKKEFAHA